MTLSEVLHDSGEAGKFGELFVGLGALFAILGAVLTALGAFSFFPAWSAGESVHTDALLVGMLFTVMGLGFATFGVMGIMSGWGRQHPEFDHS